MISRSTRSIRGVTLIELMIAVVVVAILASIALPSYRAHRLKSGRGVGASCLMEAEQRLEQHYAKTMRSPPDVGLETVGLSAECGDEPRYLLSIDTTSVCANKNTAGHYALRATPQGTQADDGILVLCVSPTLQNPSERVDQQHAVPETPDSLIAGWNFQPGH